MRTQQGNQNKLWSQVAFFPMNILNQRILGAFANMIKVLYIFGCEDAFQVERCLISNAIDKMTEVKPKLFQLK